MHKDAERVDMPESTYRDALNANLYHTKGAVVNEQGNTLIGTYASPNFAITNIIGQCSLEDGRIVLFAIDSNTGDEGTHVIALADPNLNTYKVLYRNDALNFQVNYTIEATSKVDSKGQIKVYFTDNYISRLTDSVTSIQYVDEYNPPRVFDVTKQLASVGDTVVSQTTLYGNPSYNINKLDLFMHSGDIPEFEDVSIVEGGGAISGTYHLALAYMDDDRNTTNYLVTSNAVHLVTGHEDALPTESVFGDPQGSQSNKSITWRFTVPVVNRNYTHLQPVVIQRFGGGQNQANSEFAYALDPIRITGTATQYITYTGLETVAQASINEVVLDSVRYETAKTIVQLDNRLYISNLQARGDLGYQRFANAITLEAVTEEIERFDPRHFDILNINKGYTDIVSAHTTTEFTVTDTLKDVYKPIQGNDHPLLSDEQKAKFSGGVRKGYKDVRLSFKKKSYRRSEVYAFYISFVLKDGTETYGYHIPGRQVTLIGSANDAGNVTYFSENEAIANHTPSEFREVVGLDTSEMESLYPDSKLHQITDTQLMHPSTSSISTSYWENDDEVYPTSDEFLICETDENGNAVETGNIQGEKVRHHKMPSNKHKDYSFITGIRAGDDDSNMHTQFEPNLYNLPNDNQDLELKENIRLLGVKLGNIHIPKFILKQVQGYKVYYAKRRQRDKTIIGQSVPAPSGFRGNVVPGVDVHTAKYGPYSRGFLMYGGITPFSNEYPTITSTFNNSAPYKGFPVFKFHDFNLLKNHHTLSVASHIDIQNILTFRYYGGGPGIKESPLTNNFIGGDWEPSAEIGNNAWPSDPGRDLEHIRAWVTSVFIASSYNEPHVLNYKPEFLMGYAPQGPLEEGNISTNLMTNVQTIYTLQPKGRTYLPAHTIFQNTEIGAFHGAKYLLNFGGESCIALSLTSGLPLLPGFVTQVDTPYRYDGRFWWYPKGGYLNAQSSIDNQYNDNWVLSISDTPNPDGNLQAGTHAVGGYPTAYLVNLCSLKENVYDSFDEQQLVWTGYYKSLSAVDLESGTEKDDNYYTGAESDNIFGGDTYITRYGFRSTVLAYGHAYWKGTSVYATQNDIPFNLSTGYTGTTEVWDSVVNVDDLLGTGSASDPGEWQQGNNNPIATIFYFFCESDDLIGFRHSADKEEGVLKREGNFFDGSTAHTVLFNGPLSDNTHMDNLLYMNNYSLNQDIRVTIPRPKKLDDITLYPTRTIRSNVDEGRINDRYRGYLALEFKDVPKNRGDIWDIFTLGSVLYIHTEKSLFVTKGKENLQMGGEAQAFIGSGDIFAQNPDELIPTNEGYGGTDAQFASITTRYGHFYVNRKARKVFLLSKQVEEISSLGMEKWFLDNIPYRLEDYGIDLDQNTLASTDAPTDMFGFTAAYDSKYKRIILTKRERVPTALFLTEYNAGTLTVSDNNFYAGATQLEFTNTEYFQEGGWTMSYYPEIKVWGSRHSYKPKLYAYNSSEYYSLVNSADSVTGQVWEHSNIDSPGSFFGTLYNFEFEYIDNTAPGASKVFSTHQYWTEVQKSSINNATGEMTKHTSPGFTSFYVYNTNQISGVGEDIDYLSNVRAVGKFWHINNFRDKSTITTLTNTDLVTGVANVQDNFITGVEAPTQTVTMFTEEGVVNTQYIDDNKQWYDQQRFIDHYLGVRLICNNSAGTLVHLYAAGTKHRKSFR